MKKYEVVGHAGVDAGMMMLVDPCYVLGASSTDGEDEYEYLCDEIFDSPNGVAEASGGVVITNFGGDGLYPVEVLRDDSGQVIEVRIRFQ